MKKGLCTATVLTLLLLASAAFGSPWYFSYNVSGTILNHPAQYSGILTDGGSGTLEFTLNDALWPDASDPAARFTYIWNTYFKTHYVNQAGAQRWVGVIPGSFSMVVTSAPVGYTGTMSAYIDAQFAIRDLDADRVLDDAEKFGDYNQFYGTIWKACTDPSTGEMTCTEGPGAISGGRFSFTYPPDLDAMDGTANLDLAPCASAADPSSWGNIKSLYR